MTEQELRNKVVSTAKSYVGAKYASAKHLDVLNLFNNSGLGGFTMTVDQPWCATFVSAIGIKCGLTEIMPVSASCTAMISKLQKIGEWVEDDAYVAQAGDILFYEWSDDGIGDCDYDSDHVGIVASCKNGMFEVIEGNTGNSECATNTVAVNGRFIRGFGVPDYAKMAKKLSTTSDTKSETKTETTTIKLNPTKDKPLFGIDVSYAQGNINWEKVKPKIDFAILRCGYGDNITDQDDDWWKRNADECTRLGIPFGTYVFSYATCESQAISEAEHAIRLIKGYKLSLPVYIDLEADGCQYYAVQAAKIFCERLKKDNIPCGVYSYLSWFRNYIGHELDKYPIWIAQCNNTCDWNGTYDIWQYSSTGSISGISGSVDCNYMYSLPKGSTGASSKPQSTSQNTSTSNKKSKVPVVYYAVKTENYGILPEVKNRNDYAGWDNDPIVSVKIRLSEGKAKYRVHNSTGWLDWVSTENADWEDYDNGYAGDDVNAIDALQVVGDNFEVCYQVKLENDKYYLENQYNDNTDNNQDGYAGIYGHNIVAILMNTNAKPK